MNKVSGDFQSNYEPITPKKTTKSKLDQKISSKSQSQLKKTSFLGSKSIGRWLVKNTFGSIKNRTTNQSLRDSLLAKHAHEKVFLPTSDGLNLQATLVKPDNSVPPSGKTYIFCSGSFACYESYVQPFNGKEQGILKELTRNGHQVLLFDYRGFGENFHLGDPTASGIRKDTEAAYKYVHDLGIPDADIVMYGYSLGGTGAAEVAKKHETDLVLDRIPTDLPSVARQAVPFFLKPLADLVIRYKYPLSSIKHLKNYKGKNLKIILEQEKKDPRVKKFEKAIKKIGKTPHDNMLIMKIPHIFTEFNPPPDEFLKNTHFS